MTERVALYRRKLLMLAAAWTALAGPMVIAQESASPTAKPLTFEVSTIKAADPAVQHLGVHFTGRSFTTESTSLVDLMGFAYGVQAKQVVGGPDWAYKQKFAVNAVHSGESQPDEAQWKTMIGKLLEDRFQLKFHHEQRELAVFALTVAEGEPKLAKSATAGYLPHIDFKPSRTGISLVAKNTSMWDLTEALQAGVTDRPVVDKSGVAGRVGFTLTWLPG